MDLGGLNAFRVAGTSKVDKWEWTEPRGFINGLVLGVDQSIRNTGWCLMRSLPQERLLVLETGMVRTQKRDSGHRDTLLSADAIFWEFRNLFSRMSEAVVLIAHEFPPVAGGRMKKMFRPESSLTAAVAVRCAADLNGIPTVAIGAQTVKKRLTGNPNADKALVRERLNLSYPDLVMKKPCNEHTYDAAGLAVLACEGVR